MVIYIYVCPKDYQQQWFHFYFNTIGIQLSINAFQWKRCNPLTLKTPHGLNRWTFDFTHRSPRHWPSDVIICLTGLCVFCRIAKRIQFDPFIYASTIQTTQCISPVIRSIWTLVVVSHKFHVWHAFAPSTVTPEADKSYQTLPVSYTLVVECCEAGGGMLHSALFTRVITGAPTLQHTFAIPAHRAIPNTRGTFSNTADTLLTSYRTHRGPSFAHRRSCSIVICQFTTGSFSVCKLFLYWWIDLMGIDF